MQEILEYFTAEKQESLLFMVIGVLAIALSIWLWATGNDYRTMAFPVVAIAVIQIVVGSSVYFRTDAQVAEIQQQYEQSPVLMAQSEVPRMEAVVKNFKIYKWIEIALLVTGIVVCFITTGYAAYAIGIGLIAQSAIMLVLDLFAEKRAEVYIAFLQQLS